MQNRNIYNVQVESLENESKQTMRGDDKKGSKGVNLLEIEISDTLGCI